MFMMKKSQAASEYIVLIGILLVLLIPIFYYTLKTSNENIRANQANDAVISIAKAADTVYTLGPGNRKYTWVTIPSGAKMAISGNTILIKLSLRGSQSGISQTAKGQLEAGIIGDSTISTILNNPAAIGKGTYLVKVEYQESQNTVLIGEKAS